MLNPLAGMRIMLARPCACAKGYQASQSESVILGGGAKLNVANL